MGVELLDMDKAPRVILVGKLYNVVNKEHIRRQTDWPTRIGDLTDCTLNKSECDIWIS